MSKPKQTTNVTPAPTVNPAATPNAMPGMESADYQAFLAWQKAQAEVKAQPVAQDKPKIVAQPRLAHFKLCLTDGTEITVPTTLGLSSNGKANYNGNGTAKIGEHEWRLSLNVTLPTVKNKNEIPFQVYQARCASYGLSVKQDAETGEVTLA